VDRAEKLPGEGVAVFFSRKRGEPPAMTLEGALGPNDRLESASGMAIASPDALCAPGDGRLLVSSGHEVLALAEWGGRPTVFTRFDAPVTALAASPGGLVAVGLAGGRVEIRDISGTPVEGWPRPPECAAVNDLLFPSSHELLAVDCGLAGCEDFLPRAIWAGGGDGKVVSLKRGGASRIVAQGPACPMGIAIGPDGEPVLSLLAEASVSRLDGSVVRSGLPAYPGRLRRMAGGYAIACLSRRDPLIEFLKTEPEFVAAMKSGMEPRHWISPRLTPEFSHDFPIELGATRLFGEVKPWAPSFSYGLVIETDENLMPVASAHSRANGRRHAISDIVEWQGRLLAVSRASGELLDIGAGGLRP